jgi:RNA polymerase sigma-70 factor (ECF subfamily)
MAKMSKQEIFNNAYNQYAEHVYRFIYYRCGNSSLAEDLMQDSFVRYWKHVGKIVPSKEKAYLFTIAKNLILNHQEHKQVVLKFERRHEFHQAEQTPHHALEQKEFHERLDNAISNLSEGQREVFLMNRIDGLKYREIAVLLNISQKAVEKRMSLALKELRKLYDKI